MRNSFVEKELRQHGVLLRSESSIDQGIDNSLIAVGCRLTYLAIQPGSRRFEKHCSFEPSRLFDDRLYTKYRIYVRCCGDYTNPASGRIVF